MLLRLVLETSKGPDGCAVLTASGELDTASAHTFSGAVHDALGDGFDLVVVDLSGISFIDSSGVDSLLAARRAGASHEANVALAAPSERVTDVLDLLDLSEHLHLYRDVAHALRDADPVA